MTVQPLPKQLVVFLTEPELDQFLEVVKKENWTHYFIFHFLAMTGLRVSELLSLTPENLFLNEDPPHIRVVTLKNSPSTYPKAYRCNTCGKTWVVTDEKDYERTVLDHSRKYISHELECTMKNKLSPPIRIVPLTKPLTQELIKYLTDNHFIPQETPIKYHANKLNQRLFPMTVRCIEKWAIKYGNKCKQIFNSFFKKVHPHIFRHTFATRLRRKKTPWEVISRLLGHKDIRTTINIYAGVDLEEMNDAVGSLE